MPEYVIFGAGAVGRAVSRRHNVPICDDKVDGLSVAEATKLYPNATYIITAADWNMAVDCLTKHGIASYASVECFVPLPDSRFEEYAINTCIACQNSHIHKKTFMRSLDIVVTERCTLKCRDCSNLMQHYENPKDLPLDEIIEGLTSIKGDVNEIRLIGGEPFLFKQLDKVIRVAYGIENIRYIMVYTNGTIIPSEEVLRAMKECLAIVLITEYEGLSKNAPELREVMDSYGITHHTIPPDYWTDCGEVYHRGRTPEDNYEVYRNCCAKELYTMIGKKLYDCPFMANAVRAGLIHEEADPCQYCAGRPFNAPKIKAAVQK
jgi:hypothetical protein